MIHGPPKRYSTSAGRPRTALTRTKVLRSYHTTIPGSRLLLCFTAVAMWPLLLRIASRKGGIGVSEASVGYGLRLILVLQLVAVALAKCPNWCSQHGVCTGPGDDAFCICEMGFQGDDCGIRLCPKGDDPLTTDQADRALLLRTTAEEGPLGGELTVTFNGETTTLDADAHRTGDRECASALQALPNIDKVACTRSAVSEFGAADYLISLLSFPTIPWENNHYGHFGNPALEAFSCNISSSADTGASSSCELIDIVTENVKEYTECSRHGTCVRDTGRCECSFGFGGEACDDISDSDDAQVILAEGPFFTGSTLKLRANRGLSPDYDLVRAIAGPHDVMTLTGEGDLVLHEGALHIQPQPFIYPGSGAGVGSMPPGLVNTPWRNAHPPKALTVSGGSLDVRGAGAAIRSTRANSPALSVSVGLMGDDFDGEGGDGLFRRNGTSGQGENNDGGGFSFSGVALAVNVRETGPQGAGSEGFRLLELSVGGQGGGITANQNGGSGDEGEEKDGSQEAVLLSVRGDGRVSMTGGGGVILKQGDLEVSRGDAAFKGDVAVGRALDVGGGGVSVSNGGGVRVVDGGFEVSTTSPTTTTTTTTTTPTTTVASTAVNEGGENVGGALPSAAVAVVSASHRDFSGDVLLVDAGGDGAATSGAVLLRATAAGKDVFEVKATGATSIKAGGLDVEAGGLKVGSGGATVSSGGLTVDGGLVLRSGTLVIEDGGGGELGDSGSGGFEVAHGGIRATSRDGSTSALAASAVGAGFGGAVMSISAPGQAPSGSFRLLQASVGGSDSNSDSDSNNPKGAKEEPDQDVFFVDGTGRVNAAGGLETGPAGRLTARGGLVAEGSTVLGRRRATRREVDTDALGVHGDGLADGEGGGRGGGRAGSDSCGVNGGEVEVDVSLGTFFEVPDDGREGSCNILRIKGEATPGQILMLYNGDADPTSGVAIIPPGYTVLFIHDGSSWRDIRVLEAAVKDLRGVTSLSAAANLDIGDFSLKARHLVSSGNEAGGVALFGGGGLLTSDKGLSWNSETGTLTVPRLQASEVSEGMDFKGKPARNVALVNATLDRIPFLKTTRLMLENAAAGGSSSGRVQQARSEIPGALAKVAQSVGPSHGLAVFDKKGELSRAEGVTVFPGGVVDVKGLGPHLQHGDVDFQGYTVRNLSLAGVSKITGLDRLEVRGLFISVPSPEGAVVGGRRTENIAVGPSAIAILTSEGELSSVSEAFSIDPGTGTLSTPRIGPHEVTGDVDFVGNAVRQAVLESPDIRGTVPSLHTGELRVSAKPVVSHGHLALFSSENSDDQFGGGSGNGSGKSLGLASGGGGLAWRDGALQNVRLGGTTTLEGDLDFGGHRLLNYDVELPDFDHVEELTIRNSLRLDKHKGASSLGAVLVVGTDGNVMPAEPTSLNIRASSGSLKRLVVSEEFACRGDTEIGGKVSIKGAVIVEGEVSLSAGLDAQGTAIANARLENTSIDGVVHGDVDFGGAVRFSVLKKREVAAGTLVLVGDDGELRPATGLELDEKEGVLVVERVSGHEVTGTVDYGNHALVSPALNFTVGGGITGLTSLTVGGGGLDISGVLSAASDVMVEGSVTVAGAVMGRGPYMDTSDARMKVEVREISPVDASAVVKGLRAVTYALKPSDLPSPQAANSQAWAPGGRRQHGFIAQEVERVAPEVVAEDGNGYKTVAYSRLVPTLAAALSAALDRLDNLEESSRSAPKPTTGGAGNISPANDGGSIYDDRSNTRHQNRRPTAVDARGQQPAGELDTEPAVFSLMQLWVENTALRGRMGTMEKRMIELERKLADLAAVGTAMMTTTDEISGASAQQQPLDRES